MGTIKLKVELGERSYPILIGDGALRDTGAIVKERVRGKRVAVVTNAKVKKIHGKTCIESLEKASFEVVVVTLPDGERYKNLQQISRIYDVLIRNSFDRADAILALGGGVVGDMAGFAASTYMRGITFFQAPTTLLAQVDSSVGGKTGVDYPGGKNIIGSFYQPLGVIADISSLDTLPDREYRCGLAEVIKYGLIKRPSLFNYLEENVDVILARKREHLIKVVKDSCATKAAVVGADEKESGVRAILNYGHTFGHGIETALNFRKLKHGEAVAIGMVLGARLSWALGLVDHKTVIRITSLIEKFGLPVRIPRNISSDQIIRGMKHDKKILAGNIRFIVLDRIGHAFIYEGMSLEKAADVLD